MQQEMYKLAILLYYIVADVICLSRAKLDR